LALATHVLETGKHERWTSKRKQSYFIIPEAIWNQIKALFPLAIEVKHANKAEPGQHWSDNINPSTCFECLQRPSADEGGSLRDVTIPKQRPRIDGPKRTGDDEVEIIEPPETVFELRVLEANPCSHRDEWIDDLATINGNDQRKDQDGGIDTYLRRSSRKRKQKFPIGCFRDEDTCRVDFSKNVAALRLNLVEKCCAGSTFQLHHILYLLISEDSTTSNDNHIGRAFTKENTRFEILNYARNAENLMAICEHSACKPCTDRFDPSGVVLIRVAEREPTMGGVSDEEIFEYFIALAQGESGNKAKKKKTAPVERGFNGTFLLGPNKIVEENEDNFSPNAATSSCVQKEFSTSASELTAHDDVNEMTAETTTVNSTVNITVNIAEHTTKNSTETTGETTEEKAESSSKRLNTKEPVRATLTARNGHVITCEPDGNKPNEKRTEHGSTIVSSVSPQHKRLRPQANDATTRAGRNGERGADTPLQEMVDYIVTALQRNPDLKDGQNQDIVEMAAEQVRTFHY
jgi:hypothetical protein